MNRTGLCLTVLPQLPHLRGGGHRDSTWPRLAGRPGAGELAGGRVSAWERLTLPAPDSVIVSLSLLASKVIGNSQKISNYPKKKKKKRQGQVCHGHVSLASGEARRGKKELSA